MKVAQYEVLGLAFKRSASPGRDDRNDRILLFNVARLANGKVIDRPFRDATPYQKLTQHFVLGYFHQVPPGQTFSIPARVERTVRPRDRRSTSLPHWHGARVPMLLAPYFSCATTNG